MYINSKTVTISKIIKAILKNCKIFNCICLKFPMQLLLFYPLTAFRKPALKLQVFLQKMLEYNFYYLILSKYFCQPFR